MKAWLPFLLAGFATCALAETTTAQGHEPGLSVYQRTSEAGGAIPAIADDGCVEFADGPRLRGCFDRRGAAFTANGTDDVHLRLSAWGRGDALESLPPRRSPSLGDSRVSYRYPGIAEWWQVRAGGVEHGFTVAQRPQGKGALTLALDANRTARAAADGVAWGRIRYDGLVVTDAEGRDVPAKMVAQGRRVLIVADDARAAYPLTVDPLVWVEQQVHADDGGFYDYLGTSFAMQGDVAVAGAPYADDGGDNAGAVYVFTRVGGVWSQAQKLQADDVVDNAYFGESVAVDGDTIVIGADGVAVNGASAAGAAYVFHRDSGGTWSQVQKLVASDPAPASSFGISVSVENDLIAVGADYASVGSNDTEGKVYVFACGTDGSWTQSQMLTAADGAAGTFFGKAVLIKDGTLYATATTTVLDGHSKGAAYVFEHADEGWTQTQELTSSDGQDGDIFGWSIAVSGQTMLVGAQNATVNGNQFAGAVYVFSNDGTTWTQAQKLSASDGAEFDSFGGSVAVLGPTAVIGSAYATVGTNISQGAAYVFTEGTNGIWAQSGKLTASDGELNDFFGWNVAFDGHTAGVSAIGVSEASSSQGALYLYSRSGGGPYTVTTNAVDGNGTISPVGAQSVDDGDTASFTLTPDASYRIASVDGTCGGALAGSVYTTLPVTADCTVDVHFGPIAQTVTPSVDGGHGTISPDTPQTVDYGNTLSFVLTPEQGYVPGAIGGTCGGTLSGDTFTTAPVTGSCTVVATFRLATHTVTPSVDGDHGTIDPAAPQDIADGSSAVFTLTPEPGYMVDSVTGTCGGTLDGNVFTTDAVVEDCTVVVSFTDAQYTVTPVLVTGHGTIAPGLPQTVGYQAVLQFTVVPDDGYAAQVAGTCGGQLSGYTYTTNPIVADCTVEASFVELQDTIFANGFD